MNKRTNKVDNRGSVFVLVVVCTSFIMILCSVILTATVTNREMKSIERKSKDTFYTAEVAIDEIRTGLEEYAAKHLETAYILAMGRFNDNSMTDEQKKAQLIKDFLDSVEADLNLIDGTQYRIGTLEGFLSDSSILKIKAGTNKYERTANSIIFKDVRIQVIENGYVSTIKTDIVFNAQEIGMNTTYTSPSFAEYGLIADNSILLDADDATVAGSIYSGNGGIKLDNSILNIKSGNIVTRGDITVKRESEFNVTDLDTSDTLKPLIWAKNLRTENLDRGTTYKTQINIDGKCYIADDLSLDAVNSKVTLKGEYYGYSYNYYAIPTPSPAPAKIAQNSSAVVINGKNSSLDMENVEKLLIAGRAYLIDASDSNVYTGESIAIAELQDAYLVPNDFIWCHKNPVTAAEYISRPANFVDYNNTSSFPINILDYVADSDDVLELHYPVYGQEYVYLFIKFENEDKANKYMQEYYQKFKSGNTDIIHIDNELKDKVKNITVKDSTSMDMFLTAGNIITYDSGANTSDLYENGVDYSGISSNTMARIAEEYVKRYNSVQQSLQIVPGIAPYDTASLFNSIIDNSVIDGVMGTEMIEVDLGGGDVYYVYVVNNSDPLITEYSLGTIIPEASKRKGIIIADSTVKVNYNYEGLIIASGDIKLDDGVTVTASKDMIKKIIDSCNPEVNKYFRQYSGYVVSDPSGPSTSVSISDLVTFKNWRKAD